jgi:predicted flap endonuclease-1-like 5' DNA nuclease
MMQLFVYLLLAAVLGFALGWLIRGGSAGAETSAQDTADLEGAKEERERLASELQAAQAARRDVEQVRADLDVAHRRIVELEAELGDARRVQEGAEPRATEPANDGIALRAAAATGSAQSGAVAGDGEAGVPPEQLTAPHGRADDLKRISGIGPSIEKMLNGLGIYHFRQIAAFTPENVAWVDRRLRFRGRIAREDWIGQAKALSEGDPPSARA